MNKQLIKALSNKGMTLLKEEPLGRGRFAVLAQKGTEKVSYMYNGKLNFPRTGRDAEFYFGLQLKTKESKFLPYDKVREA